mmetsp:Transcript_34246/g.81223  ORF Transcript_34246/g.81223 Transcript_34246/m.81223 type:complete len:253 (+) Transcript_34246:324-1082(+)
MPGGLRELVEQQLVDGEPVALPVRLDEVGVAPRLEAADKRILPPGIRLCAWPGGPVELTGKPLVCCDQLGDLREVALVVRELLQAVGRHDVHRGCPLAGVEAAAVRVCCPAVARICQGTVHALCARPLPLGPVIPKRVELRCDCFPVCSAAWVHLGNDLDQELLLTVGPAAAWAVLPLTSICCRAGRSLFSASSPPHLRLRRSRGSCWGALTPILRGSCALRCKPGCKVHDSRLLPRCGVLSFQGLILSTAL